MYLVELHRVKDLAYGDAWCRRGEASGIFPNVARKYDRWWRIRHEEGLDPTAAEPLDDTLADLLIYGVKYYLWLTERSAVTPLAAHIDGSVADGLRTVTATQPISDPAARLGVGFATLESVFASESPDFGPPADRLDAVWDVIIGAWGELSTLPVPTGQNLSPIPQLEHLNFSAPTAPLAADLARQLVNLFTAEPGPILILGATAAGLEVQAQLLALGLGRFCIGLTAPGAITTASYLLPWQAAVEQPVTYLVVADDQDKRELLNAYEASAPTGPPFPRVILSGIAHLNFRDELYDELNAPALVPSYATGYPFTRVHIFQHLQAAAANGLSGAIVELGAFKGGTTAWLAGVADRLHLDGPVLAFDSWDGFPPRRSLLDMYEHPRCVFKDIESVRAYLEPRGVELVLGDIADTAPARLANTPVLLAFVDTDNFSPAFAALQTLRDNVVAGGAIVFDHYTTTEDYIYTLGERIAGQRALVDHGFMQVHGTGIFVRLPTTFKGEPGHPA